MGLKVLVVAGDEVGAVQLLSLLPAGSTREVAYTNKPEQAIQNLRKHKYDMILLGDQLLRGTTYEVGLALRGDKKNWGVPVVCIGDHPTRMARLEHLLSPYGFRVNLADAADVGVCVSRITEMVARGH